MKIFQLISFYEREFQVTYHETKEDAQDRMRTEFAELLGYKKADIILGDEEKYGNMAAFYENEAWANEVGASHANIDWRIEEIDADGIGYDDDISVEKDDIKVVLENIGEGWSGDYDPDNPKDENLLRFTVYQDGEQVDDASYCTTIRADTPRVLLYPVARRILNEVYEPLKDGNSIKKLCEELSWITV